MRYRMACTDCGRLIPMRYGKTVHVSQLHVGDVVRPVRGNSYPAQLKAGDTDDFREGYDAMTVVFRDEKYLTFHRPHVEIYDGEQRVNHVQVAVEIVGMVPRDHSGLHYEVLAPGPHHKDDKGMETSHWGVKR
jgi:hypothetical protein